MKNHSEAVNPIDALILVKRELSTVYVGSNNHITQEYKLHKNKYVILILFLVGLILLIKFISDLGKRPTDSSIIFTLGLVILGFANIRPSYLLDNPNTELWNSYLRRLFRIIVICLVICLVANLIYPATGILTTILTWVIGHTAVAIIKGSASASNIIGRLSRMTADRLPNG